jgi:flagellar hook-associated protein 2
MATITAAGIGSGLDIESIVSQLVELESQPLFNNQDEQALVNAQISAYGTLKSKISDFQTAMAGLSTSSKFQVFQGTSSNESVFTASVASEAATGTYSVEVVNLAERDKVAFGPYVDSNATLNSGTLNISVGADSFSVTVGASDSLATIAESINSAADNTGVTATLITSDDGTRLVLTGDDTGLDNALTISVSGDGDGNDADDAGLSALTYVSGGSNFATIDALSTAIDAQVKIDTYTITSSSNTISSAVSGVSFTAKSVGTASLTVTRDDEAILESVNAFADAFNELRTEINTQRSGQLEADSTLLSLERSIFDVLNSGSAITGSVYSYLIEAGVSIDEDGVMNVNTDEVTSALNADFDSFVNLFSATNEGFAYRLESLADGWLATDGLIDAREDGLQSQLDRLEDDEARLEVRLEIVETRIRAQFTALDTLVSELTNTGNFLISQLQSLPAANNNSN